MGISISQQTVSFLQSLLLGAALGLLYDGFRILRLLIPSGKIIAFLEDIAYFLLCGFISFAFLLAVNNGIIRAYLLIGELLGAVLYYFTLGKCLYRIADKMIALFRKFLALLYRLFLSPFVRLFRAISHRIRRIADKVGKNFSKNAIKSKYRLKERHRLLYNVDKYHTRSQRPRRRRGVIKHENGQKK